MNAQDTSSPFTSSGEARSRRRRRVFYAIFLFSLLLGLAAGFGHAFLELIAANML